jgi:hypothetical protein
MLSRLQDFVVSISRTWWLYLTVFALFAGSLRALTIIGARFPEFAAGAEPFDLQHFLQASEVYPQLAGYTAQARELYYAFTLIDFAFPFFAGLFVAATIAFALRSSVPRFYQMLVTRKLLLLPMLTTGFDWLENLTIISLIGLYPTTVGWLAVLLVVAKKFKLVGVLLGYVSMLVSLLIAASFWLFRRRKA